MCLLRSACVVASGPHGVALLQVNQFYCALHSIASRLRFYRMLLYVVVLHYIVLCISIALHCIVS